MYQPLTGGVGGVSSGSSGGGPGLPLHHHMRQSSTGSIGSLGSYGEVGSMGSQMSQYGFAPPSPMDYQQQSPAHAHRSIGRSAADSGGSGSAAMTTFAPPSRSSGGGGMGTGMSSGGTGGSYSYAQPSASVNGGGYHCSSSSSSKPMPQQQLQYQSGVSSGGSGHMSSRAPSSSYSNGALAPSHGGSGGQMHGGYSGSSSGSHSVSQRAPPSSGHQRMQPPPSSSHTPGSNSYSPSLYAPTPPPPATGTSYANAAMGGHGAMGSMSGMGGDPSMMWPMKSGSSMYKPHASSDAVSMLPPPMSAAHSSGGSGSSMHAPPHPHAGTGTHGALTSGASKPSKKAMAVAAAAASAASASAAAAAAAVPPLEMEPEIKPPRVDLQSRKACLDSLLGDADTQAAYWNLVEKYLMVKLSKKELDTFVVEKLGRNNVHVHNDFFLAVLQNAHSDELPPKPLKSTLKKSTAGTATAGADGVKKEAKSRNRSKKEGAAGGKEKKEKEKDGTASAVGPDGKKKRRSTKKGTPTGDDEVRDATGVKKGRSQTKGGRATADAEQPSAVATWLASPLWFKHAQHKPMQHHTRPSQFFEAVERARFGCGGRAGAVHELGNGGEADELGHSHMPRPPRAPGPLSFVPPLQGPLHYPPPRISVADTATVQHAKQLLHNLFKPTPIQPPPATSASDASTPSPANDVGRSAALAAAPVLSSNAASASATFPSLRLTSNSPSPLLRSTLPPALTSTYSSLARMHAARATAHLHEEDEDDEDASIEHTPAIDTLWEPADDYSGSFDALEEELDAYARMSMTESQQVPDKNLIRKRLYETALQSGVRNVSEGAVSLLQQATEQHLRSIIAAIVGYARPPSPSPSATLTADLLAPAPSPSAPAQPVLGTLVQGAPSDGVVLIPAATATPALVSLPGTPRLAAASTSTPVALPATATATAAAAAAAADGAVPMDVSADSSTGVSAPVLPPMVSVPPSPSHAVAPVPLQGAAASATPAPTLAATPLSLPLPLPPAEPTPTSQVHAAHASSPAHAPSQIAGTPLVMAPADAPRHATTTSEMTDVAAAADPPATPMTATLMAAAPAPPAPAVASPPEHPLRAALSGPYVYPELLPPLRPRDSWSRALAEPPPHPNRSDSPPPPLTRPYLAAASGFPVVPITAAQVAEVLHAQPSMLVDGSGLLRERIQARA